MATKKTSKKRATKAAKPLPEFEGFDPGLLQFLAELGLNNEREWFDANKARYERSLREPALAFIRAMRPKLARISKQMLAVDKKVGGSLMRVYRDVRFSKDKTPYKTHVGIQFRHVAGKDIHAPGYYLHIAPEEIFLGAGTWRPDSPTLGAIRSSIADQSKAWVRARDNKTFKHSWEIGGDSLTRPPRGYDKAHPMIEDLKRKDHIAFAKLSVDELLADDLVDQVAQRFAEAKPYMRWLCKTIELPF